MAACARESLLSDPELARDSSASLSKRNPGETGGEHAHPTGFIDTTFCGLGSSPPSVDRTWGIWGSCYDTGQSHILSS